MKYAQSQQQKHKNKAIDIIRYLVADILLF